MSDTPRTDDEAFMLDDGQGEAVMSDFARQLERENAALRADIADAKYREWPYCNCKPFGVKP